MTPDTYNILTDYLARYYDVTLYERHSIKHPVTFYPVSEEQATDIDSVLSHLTTDFQPRDDMAFYNYGHLHTLQNSGRNLFNGVTYDMRRLRTNPVRLDASLGYYFDMIATCGALEAELLDVITEGLVRLPMRTQYHREIDAQQSLTSGKGRSATIGGVMLIVFNDGESYRALLSRRTKAHATDPGAFHLIPAFIFQPSSPNNAREDWSFKHHLYREYLEELVGMPEGALDMMSHPALHDLQAMETDGRAEIRLTGITFNLLTLRPEIGAVLIIHDATWWATLQSGERGYRLDTPEAAGNLKLLPVNKDKEILAVLPRRYYLNMVPQAIPAFWAGIETARLLIATYGE